MTILQLRLLSRAIVQKEVKVQVQMKVTSKILLQKRQKTQSPNSVDFDSPATSFFRLSLGQVHHARRQQNCHFPHFVLRRKQMNMDMFLC